MTNVSFTSNEYFKNEPFDISAAVYIKMVGSGNNLIFNQCNFKNNTFFQGTKILYIDEHASTVCISPHNEITVSNHNIFSNTIYNGGKILYINGQSDYDIQISNTIFVYNLVDDYIFTALVNSIAVHIIESNFINNNVTQSCIFLSQNSLLVLNSSHFINNIGNCMSLSQANVFIVSSNFASNIGGCINLFQCNVTLSESVLFDSNTADKSAALYMDQKTGIAISSGSTIWFLKTLHHWEEQCLST